jgi:signal peptidase
MKEILSVGIFAITVFIMWNGLKYVTGTSAPVMAVLSNSMEPVFSKGDIIFVTHNKEPFVIGEIIVYNIPSKDIPIVHRIIDIWDKDGEVKILTKGDNNNVDDKFLYAAGQPWLTPNNVQGRVKASVPYIGIVNVFAHDYPWLKVTLIAAIGMSIIWHFVKMMSLQQR